MGEHWIDHTEPAFDFAKVVYVKVYKSFLSTVFEKKQLFTKHRSVVILHFKP